MGEEVLEKISIKISCKLGIMPLPLLSETPEEGYVQVLALRCHNMETSAPRELVYKGNYRSAHKCME